MRWLARALRTFERSWRRLTDERDPVQSLWDIGPDGWGHEAFERVARITGNEFYDIFKRLRGKELSKAIQGALRFRRISNADDTMKGIVSAAEAALHRIAAESAINERRVRMKYGVLLPPGSVPKPKAPRRKPPGITVRLR
jgi:hypothetical protein